MRDDSLPLGSAGFRWKGCAVALADWLLPRAPREALRFVRQLTPEDPRFAQAVEQARSALEPESPLPNRSMAVDVLGALGRSEPARELLAQAARSDPSWRLRLKARSLLRRLTGY